jgi:hypothetical protein
MTARRGAQQEPRLERFQERFSPFRSLGILGSLLQSSSLVGRPEGSHIPKSFGSLTVCRYQGGRQYNWDFSSRERIRRVKLQSICRVFSS